MGNGQFGDALENSIGDDAGSHCIRCGQDHGKLLAAVTGDQIARAKHHFLEHLGNLLQAVVAGLMPVGIVEALEVIDIDHQQRQGTQVATLALPLVAQFFVKAAAVGDSRQSVAGGQLFKRGLRPAVIGHVAQGFNDSQQLSVGVIDGAGVDGEIEFGAEAGHDAPVFRVDAESRAGGIVVGDVERLDFFHAALHQQISEAGPG